MERASTLAALIKKGTKKEYRAYLLLLVILVLVGSILAIGAAYPILSPFLYSMF
jgi:TRAP-type C4-dicarboxylate transport system permease large subunit